MGNIRRFDGRHGGRISLNCRQKFSAEGNNLTHDWEADPDAQALEERIEDYGRRTGRPDLLKKVRGWRRSAQTITRNFAQAKRRPRAGAAAPVPVDRLGDRSATEDEIFQRYGSLDLDTGTTEKLKFYDLTQWPSARRNHSRVRPHHRTTGFTRAGSCLVGKCTEHHPRVPPSQRKAAVGGCRISTRGSIVWKTYCYRSLQRRTPMSRCSEKAPPDISNLGARRMK